MTAYNPEEDGAKMSFAKDMSYIDYLSLDPILEDNLSNQTHRR